MTTVLDKNLHNIFQIKEENKDYFHNNILYKDEIVRNYHNLKKHNIFDKEIIKNDFITIIEYNIYYLYGSYTSMISSCMNYINCIKNDFHKYLDYDNFKVKEIYYNPYLSIFVYNFLKSNCIECTFSECTVNVSKKDVIDCVLSFKMDDVTYKNGFNFVIVAEINGFLKYYLISTFYSNGYDRIKPKVINITEHQYNSFKEYINNHDELQTINTDNENVYYIDKLPEETNEDEHSST